MCTAYFFKNIIIFLTLSTGNKSLYVSQIRMTNDKPQIAYILDFLVSETLMNSALKIM